MCYVSHLITFVLAVILAREDRQKRSWKEAAVGVCKFASLGLRSIPLTVNFGKSQQCLLRISEVIPIGETELLGEKLVTVSLCTPKFTYALPDKYFGSRRSFTAKK